MCSMYIRELKLGNKANQQSKLIHFIQYITVKIIIKKKKEITVFTFKTSNAV